MTGDELRAYRERQGWTRQQLAELFSASLERPVSKATVADWERGRSKVRVEAAQFLASLDELDTDIGDILEGEHEPPSGPGDSAPPPPPPSGEPRPSLELIPGGDPRYARICEELWEIVATGVGVVGAVTSSETLQADGRIIVTDKKELGKAWGKLAETNPTFRRWLMSASTGGAWIEVALATGITAGRVLRNHQQARPPDHGTVASGPEPGPQEPEPEVMYGDSAVVNFPQH